jgi:hypothetical protein
MDTNEKLTETKKVYAKPSISQELELETRAGSPLGFPNPLNLPGVEK